MPHKKAVLKWCKIFSWSTKTNKWDTTKREEKKTTQDTQGNAPNCPCQELCNYSSSHVACASMIIVKYSRTNHSSVELVWLRLWGHYANLNTLPLSSLTKSMQWMPCTKYCLRLEDSTIQVIDSKSLLVTKFQALW